MAGKVKDIIRNCKQATLLAVKREERLLTFPERIRLSVHLVFCDACKQFIQQSALINKAMKGFTGRLDNTPPYRLSEAAKEKLQQQIDRHN
ncbi:MAG: hypothetical protein H7Y86_14315 [Rhizobacter sp.]|nr:hypothetical protein [Ferruginibacter sp.]